MKKQIKPYELMTEKEQEEYNLAVHKAKLAGDDGVLPDGRTNRQAREEYIQQCKDDPQRTRMPMEAQTVKEVLKGEETGKDDL